MYTKRSHTFSFPTAGSSATIFPGSLQIPKGKMMIGLTLEFIVKVNNSSGAPVSLVAADRKKILESYKISSFKYGENRVAFQSVNLWTLSQVIQRECYGSQIPGFADTSTGLLQPIGATSTDDVVFSVTIPTGRLAKWEGLGHQFGMGPSQCLTVQVDLLRDNNPSGLTTNLTITDVIGSVVCNVYPDLRSCKGDRWTYIPQYVENSISDYRFTFDDGCPIVVTERTAVHASTALTRLNKRIDREVLAEDLAPKREALHYLETPNYDSNGDITDVATVLHRHNQKTDPAAIPTGRLTIEQPGQELNPMLLGILSFPVVSLAERKKDVARVANLIRHKAINAISAFVVDGWHDLPANLSFIAPMVLTDEDDAEFGSFLGLFCPFQGSADVGIPGAVKDNLVAQAASLKARNAGPRALAKLARNAASHVPGAAATGRGINIESEALSKVNAIIS